MRGACAEIAREGSEESEESEEGASAGPRDHGQPRQQPAVGAQLALGPREGVHQARRQPTRPLAAVAGEVGVEHAEECLVRHALVEEERLAELHSQPHLRLEPRQLRRERGEAHALGVVRRPHEVEPTLADAAEGGVGGHGAKLGRGGGVEVPPVLALRPADHSCAPVRMDASRH